MDVGAIVVVVGGVEVGVVEGTGVVVGVAGGVVCRAPPTCRGAGFSLLVGIVLWLGF